MDGEQELFYPHVAAFVSDRLVHLYARRLGQTYVWCPEWFRHAEALSRLDALWRAWEHLRLDPATGISVWWRDHADPHMWRAAQPGRPVRRVPWQPHRVPDPAAEGLRAARGLFFDQRKPNLRGI